MGRIVLLRFMYILLWCVNNSKTFDDLQPKNGNFIVNKNDNDEYRYQGHEWYGAKIKQTDKRRRLWRPESQLESITQEHHGAQSNQPACEAHQYQCANGICIDSRRVCNDYNDCGDWSDEAICDCTLPDMFYCDEYADFPCIPNDYVCDGIPTGSCQNREEMYCGDKCGGFQCASGLCLWEYDRCDMHKDCGEGDNSDELGCSISECDAHYQHVCDNGVCIYTYWLCDGVNDCGDWSDEGQDCVSNDCSGEFQCTSGECLSYSYVCDGRAHCFDGLDEKQCSDCSGDDVFLCDNGACINSYYTCNGYFECGGDDVSDETNCNCTAKSKRFLCDNGICIHSYAVCDGSNDCKDNSDEKDCFCTENSFVCDNGFCVPANAVCDGYDTCHDASDERHCGCSDDEFQCSNGLCIIQDYICDHRPDCTDYSDEIGCKCNSNDHFLCANGVCGVFGWFSSGDFYDNRCSLNQMITFICADASHIIGCYSNCTSESEFLCDDGTCLGSFVRCDGNRHCPDRSDEMNCPDCNGERFLCDNGYCTRSNYRCDGEDDCGDGSDELGCDDPCYINPCTNGGSCIGESNEHFQCLCVDGYQGELCEKESGSSNGITCEDNSMSVNVDKHILFDYLHLKDAEADEFHLNDPNCVGVELSDDIFTFRTLLYDCDTTSLKGVGDNSTTITYMNSVYSERGTEVIEMVCHYPDEYVIEPVHVITNPCTPILHLEGFGSFSVEGTLYKNESFDKLLDPETDFPLTICDGVLIYLGISVKVNDDNLEMSVDHCFASESTDPHETSHAYDMIVDGCPGATVTEFTTTPTNALEKHYSWDAYHVVNGDNVAPDNDVDLYIHCAILICRKGENDPRCHKHCDGTRRRRSVYDGGNNAYVTHGPFRNSVDNTLCHV